jgi:P-type E1-E2 ATPase
MPPPEPGVTRLWMALDKMPAGYFDARDALRPDAAEAVAALRRAGLRVLMLTGDSAAAAAPIAQQAGITEIEAGLDPAGKLARIRALQQSGLRVAMVGDGINDAAALAQADAGIAMGTGADLAQEAGDVLLLRAHPAAIPAALDLARSTLRVMRQNLIWAAATTCSAFRWPRARSIPASTFCSAPGWPPPPWPSVRSACWPTACACAAGRPMTRIDRRPRHDKLEP